MITPRLDAELVRAAAAAVRPRPLITPSEWARQHATLASPPAPRAGPWDPDVFPYLDGVQDSFAEALEGGRNWVLMKSAQGAGSSAALNCWGWQQTYYPGPALYLISKEEHAEAFGKERVAPLIAGAAPLRETFLAGRAGGETATSKRFTNGSLELAGGRSVLNLQTAPYRAVYCDEFDSLQDVIGEHGDLLKLAEKRTNAWAMFGPTIVAAFAHPSRRERGIGRVYYELSDQRRGHVACPHCGRWFPVLWSCVKVLPREGQSPAAAERDPRAYHFVAPCCGCVLTDGERYRACRRVEQRSVLPPDVATSRKWIGVHFSNLMQSKPLVELALEWIEGLDRPSVRTVVVNKSLGDVVEDDEGEEGTSIDAWVALQVDDYQLGEVPDGVQFLTAGQDSGLLELHWSVWGWGLVETAEAALLLCGWLVDAGVVAGPAAVDPARRSIDAADLAVFDQVLYERTWPAQDGRHLRVEQGLHDSGYFPIAAYEYCRAHPKRAIPSKGAAEASSSKAPPTRWSEAPTWRVGGRDVRDPALRRCDMNTFVLKTDLVGMTAKRFNDRLGAPRARLAFPLDVPPGLLEHHASERLVTDGTKRAWKKRGPNHWWDTTVMAYAAALNCSHFLKGKTAEERPSLRRAATSQARPAPKRRAESGWQIGRDS